MAYEKIHESINFSDRQAPSITANVLNSREATFEELDNRTVELSIFNESVPEIYATKEEVTESIAELETEISENYATKAEVSRTVERLESEFSDTYATRTEVSNVETHLSNFQNLADKIYATKEELAEVSETVTEIATEVSKGKADVILANESGESIHLTDSTDSKAVEFALLGKATQNGTPTPSAPIDIEVSGADGSVTVTTSNEDNTNSSTATISTPNGLAGINGVCDEIVKYADGSGKKIQRIGKSVFDGSESWTLDSETNFNENTFTAYCSKLPPIAFYGRWVSVPSLCNRLVKSETQVWDNKITNECFMVCKHSEESANEAGQITIRLNKDRVSTISSSAVKAFFASNPMTVYYELAEPIITDLSAEEVAELEVQTFYPTTNILNDANCGMEVTYKADTKNYIDKIIGERITALETALINNI